MLIQDRLTLTKLPAVERAIADFILNHLDQIENLSISDLAQQSFTTPSAIVRLSKKMGYSGWKDFRLNLVKEIAYLQGTFQDIDANFPFTAQDSTQEIIENIGHVYQESVQDTLYLVSSPQIDQAVDLLEKASRIVLFGIGEILPLCQRFLMALEKIGKIVYMQPLADAYGATAHLMKEEECALLISYSGESNNLIIIAEILKHHHIPMVAITSCGENSLSKLATVSLPLTTREKEFSKIYSYSSMVSINLVLDLLYSTLFARDYEKNMSLKIGTARNLETGRKITNQILLENSKPLEASKEKKTF